MSDCRKCVDFEWCKEHEECDLFNQKQMTNADRIRSMSDEELAEWLERIRLCCATDLCGRSCPLKDICYSKADTPTKTIDWLKQEAT